MEVLRNTLEEMNLYRANQGFKTIEIDCLLILNDANQGAHEQLKAICAPRHAEIIENHPNLHLNIAHINQKFEDAMPEILALINDAEHSNLLFNLDQCGHSKVSIRTITSLLSLSDSVEVFFTFAIEAFRAYLSADKTKNQVHLNGFDALEDLQLAIENGDLINKMEWLARTEKSLFNILRGCAKYVSPFSIHNPDGWRYWLMHFANRTKARQVYNDVLHDNCSHQAHFGRAGLNMLAYDPAREDGSLYLFDESARAQARDQLYDDIPRLIEKCGDVMEVEHFYAAAYNTTAAHSQDINAMMIENPDVKVLTESGGERRKPNTIKTSDIIQLDRQTSFFQTFGLEYKRKAK